jgi:hypothetical protein
VRRKEAGFYGVTALIMVGVLVLVSIPLQNPSSTKSSIRTSTETPGCQGSTVVQNGAGYPDCLQLTVGVNSTTLSVGQSLQISVDLVNALPYANNVNTPVLRFGPNGSYLFGGFPISTWPGDCLNPFPLQFIVLEGNYTLGTLPAADPDYIIGEPSCASADIATQFAFGAGSDQVNMTAESCTAACSPYPGTRLSTPYRLESDFSVMGYWNTTFARINPLIDSIYTTPAPNGGDGSTFGYPEVAPLGQIAFVPGVYTLAVSTFWGQAEVVQFTVK